MHMYVDNIYCYSLTDNWWVRCLSFPVWEHHFSGAWNRSRYIPEFKCAVPVTNLTPYIDKVSWMAIIGSVSFKWSHKFRLFCLEVSLPVWKFKPVVSSILPYKVKMQYVQVSNIIDTFSVKCLMLGQPILMVKTCMDIIV